MLVIGLLVALATVLQVKGNGKGKKRVELGPTPTPTLLWLKIIVGPNQTCMLDIIEQILGL